MDSEVIFWLVAAGVSVIGWIVLRAIANRVDQGYISWIRDGEW